MRLLANFAIVVAFIPSVWIGWLTYQHYDTLTIAQRILWITAFVSLTITWVSLRAALFLRPRR